jgi:hypothetical protein
MAAEGVVLKSSDIRVVLAGERRTSECSHTLSLIALSSQAAVAAALVRLLPEEEMEGILRAPRVPLEPVPIIRVVVAQLSQVVQQALHPQLAVEVLATLDKEAPHPEA